MRKIYLMVVMQATCGYGAFAQRYLEEIFSEVNVTSNVTYGVNASVLTYASVGEAIPINLNMDIYEPVGDSETNRPVVLYFHTGNFLPYPVNGGTGGSKTDSTAVEICSRMAKMGYVAISCDYRLGWNPLATTQPERTFTLINAAYRGVQDCRTAVRYLRKSVAESANPYGIDESKICVWGEGTGGYIAFAASTLDNWLEDIATIPKFVWQPAGQPTPIPMVIESINGNADGTTVGINPLDLDTLCYTNHVNYPSNFNVMVNMGGAMGDLSWLEDTSVPMISFHIPTDPFAPYAEGIVVVPTTNENVVEVSGSYSVQEAANAFTNNTIFQLADSWAPGLPYTTQANLNNNGFYGLYPIQRSGANIYDSSPWAWWDPALIAQANSDNGFLTNPDMSAMKARTFIDTIQAYASPRIMCALELPGSPCDLLENDLCSGAVDINSLTGGAVGIAVQSGEYTNVGATGNDVPDGFDCFAEVDADVQPLPSVEQSVWFTFTGDGGAYTIQTTDCGGSATFAPDGDTQIAIYEGTCNGLVPVACNDDINFGGGILWSGAEIETTEGTTYYVMVDGYYQVALPDFEVEEYQAEGTFCLSFTNVDLTAPLNDICSGAVDINALFDGDFNEVVSTTAQSNVAATAEDPANEGVVDCFVEFSNEPSLDNSVWFSFVGDGDQYVITTTNCDGTAIFDQEDTQMIVYSGADCNNLSLVECNDDVDVASNLFSTVTMVAEAGVTYYVMIDGFNYGGNPTQGDFCIEVIDNTVGVNEIAAVEFNIYPNPANNQFTVSANEKIETISIRNLMGELVFAKSAVNTKNYQMIVEIAQGIYMVEVETAQGRSTRKLIIK